ncbi:dTMP kinase [Candidatus Saccharibacteria bacterium]|nr:dTMP kinase [Candidatus Saccharibacteria bacterium]MCB9817162.1 dTMP kinase [Candidatus Nomurabacteria bacterium]HPD98807.1 dTMP kinase [Candidatus Saccharibacteria bacterium]
MSKGYYIVLEGPEGVGKTTQIELIARQLQKYGYAVRLFREPDSQSHLSARAIRQITQDPNYPLNTRAEVLLYNAARALSLEVIKQAREQGVICLVDRNYLTTLAIQYYGRGDVPDYDTITSIINFAVGDMEPDLTVILDAPVDELGKRMKRRKHGERFDNLDLGFLDRVRAGYLVEAKQRGYPVVFANESSEKVFRYVWEYVAALFNKQPAKTQPSVHMSSPPPILRAPSSHEPNAQTAAYLDTTANPITITDAGRQKLSSIVTNNESNVYAFNDTLDQVTVAAAMARLSRRGDDMRVTLLDEFVDKAGKDEGLIQRVVTAYGDDSVQQLVGIHMVVENASNLLTKQIEWGRLASYLEQSTRYIYYDQKDASGRYKYYVPTTLSSATKKQYIKTMDQLFDNYSKAVRGITDYLHKTDSTPQKERDGAWRSAIRAQACDAARYMLPVATKSTVGIYASGQAIESLIMRLMADGSKEARLCGKALLTEARKIIPAFLERADKPERGGATVAYRADTRQAMHALVQKLLPETYSSDQSAVTLTHYYPKNELDVVPHMVYEHTTMSEQEANAAIADLPYKHKVKLFSSYIGERLNRRHKPGRALERITYSWDIVCDYGIFRDLQRHRMVSDLAWQPLTPRYGYDIPELIEKAGMTETYLDSFDTSLELHSNLVAAKKITESQYATLFGHKMRWKATMNAREAMHFIELRTSPQGHPGYRKLAKIMYDKIAEVHPMVSEAMRFVNKDEDAELTRLAAERYTQYKLKVLDKK